MPRRAADTQAPARAGRALVRVELERRGATIRERVAGGVRYLELVDAEGRAKARVRVKTRQSGTWQARTTNGAPDPKPTEIPMYWAFVDMSIEPPRVYVSDDVTVRKGIHDGHQAYLAKHGGRRAENQESDHHAITLDRVERWNRGWKVLGLRGD
jgi:hypothetical protein